MPGSWESLFIEEEELSSQEVLNKNLAESMEDTEDNEVFYDAVEYQDEKKEETQKLSVPQQIKAVVEVKTKTSSRWLNFWPIKIK